MKPTVDVYARVSRKGDKEQRSTDGQTQACLAVLAERGLAPGLLFVDDGKSAWDPDVTRPDWERLMTRLESGESDGVIVFDLERFARQPKDGERLINAARRGLLVLDSDAEYDLTTSTGKKAFRDAMTAAAYYSDRLRDRTRRGKAQKATAGQVDRRRSFGFESDGITVRGDEAEVIRECARRLLAGQTQDSVINLLLERGVPTVRGARWGYTTFRQLMIRPRNVGYIVHKGEIVEGVRLPGEPILDETTWRRIVALYESRRPGRPPSGRYLLTGLAYCACGSRLAGRPVTGTNRKHYWCKGCRGISVSDVRLDEWAGDWVIKILRDPEHADAIAQAEHEAETRRAALSSEAAGIEATLIELAARLGRQEMSLARHDAAAVPLDARLAEIRAELDTIPVTAPAAAHRTISARDQRYVGWMQVWDEGDTAERRAMVVRALNGRRIVVGPGTSARFDPDRVSVQ